MARSVLSLFTIALLASCSKDDNDSNAAKDPNKAEVVSVDRFSASAGHLQVRTASNGLPAANAPINFDQGPFITRGFTPNGKAVDYYNFDVQPTAPAPIWAVFKSNGTAWSSVSPVSFKNSVCAD